MFHIRDWPLLGPERRCFNLESCVVGKEFRGVACFVKANMLGQKRKEEIDYQKSMQPLCLRFIRPCGPQRPNFKR